MYKGIESRKARRDKCFTKTGVVCTRDLCKILHKRRRDTNSMSVLRNREGNSPRKSWEVSSVLNENECFIFARDCDCFTAVGRKSDHSGKMAKTSAYSTLLATRDAPGAVHISRGLIGVNLDSSPDQSLYAFVCYRSTITLTNCFQALGSKRQRTRESRCLQHVLVLIAQYE